MKYLKPIEKIYHAAVNVKNYFYDSGLAKPTRLGIPVVSIGNLSFGGVGKTPCVILLAEELSKYYQINVITKSYKAELKEPRRVDLSSIEAWKLFGDEACLIRSKLHNCNVWSGPNKSETALASLVDEPTLCLLDDGFSHRKLGRNFDLLLIDATEGLEGLLREAKSHLKRAHAVLITKINLVGSHTLSAIKEQVLELAPALENNIYFSSVKTELKVDKKDPLFVFCGLGKPETFVQDLQNQGYNIAYKKFFDDHHQYNLNEEQEIYKEFLSLQEKTKNLQLVATEKDFIKLGYSELKNAINLTQHKIEINKEQKEVLIEKIRQSF